MTYPLGQTLLGVFYANATNHPPTTRLISVTKIGKRWATFMDPLHPDNPRLGGRFDLNTWRMDGGRYISPGEVYRDEAHYEAQLALREAWKDLHARFPRHPPKCATMEDVVRIKNLLDRAAREAESEEE